MTNPNHPLADIASKRRRLWSFTNLFSTDDKVRVYCPTTTDEIKRIFAYAKAKGRAVTLHGGGHSFDSQSLGDCLVISTEAFNTIEVLDGARVRVGAGATWGDILETLEPHGLVPAVTVTTEHATAGGTLSGDCLSRFSPAWGKEGEWIESFTIVTPDGTERTCRRPKDSDPGRWTLDERVFMAAIGGLGYIGAVTSITYRLLEVPLKNGRIKVKTSVSKHHTNIDFAKALVTTGDRMGQKPDPKNEGKHDAIYGALSPTACGTKEGLILKSTFSTSSSRRGLLLFVPKLWPRILLEWAIRAMWFNRAFWRFAFRFFFSKEEKHYVNQLAGYTFFMDGNVRAKKLARMLTGRRLKMIQQTFIVPVVVDQQGKCDLDESAKRLVAFLEEARKELEPKGLTPTLHDVLYLPADDPFPLSATAGMAGFAVSYAFETSSSSAITNAKDAFIALSDVLLECGGRVYLVKNVYAKAATLAKMYGANAASFFDVKDTVDPYAILRNGFFDKHLEALRGAAPPQAKAA